MLSKINVTKRHQLLIDQYRNQVDQAMSSLSHGDFRTYLVKIKQADELGQRIRRLAPRKIL